jgi:hypothetical protein
MLKWDVVREKERAGFRARSCISRQSRAAQGWRSEMLIVPGVRRYRGVPL